MGSKANKSNNPEEKKSLENFLNNELISKEIVNDCYTNYDSYNNTFCTFKSINNIFYLIYATKDKSIIFMNLINNQKLNEVKEAHNEEILSFRHYLDENNNKDLLMSLSRYNLKLWDVNNNFECKLELSKESYLSSAYFLNDKNQIYIATAYFESALKSKPITIFDLNGNKVKEINDSKEGKFYIEVYNKNAKNYIITANSGSSISYDYNKNKVYNVYSDGDSNYHSSVLVTNDNKIIISSKDRTLKIFNFNSGKLLHRIENKYEDQFYRHAYGIMNIS